MEVFRGRKCNTVAWKGCYDVWKAERDLTNFEATS